MNATSARLLIPAALLATLALTGCSGSGGDADGGTSDLSAAGDAPAAREDAATADDAGGAADAAAPPDADVKSIVATQQSVIRTGNVALRARDVGRAQIEVQKVVDRHSGQVADEETQTDEHGRPAYTRLTVRIPTADFADAVTDLKGIGELESATSNQEDVTSQVIDVRTRIDVQKRSITRISVLFQQATSIKDIMAIEAELSQRQADLEALEQQSAHLADQTSMSTIVVSVDRISSKEKPDEQDDDTGFLAGLSAGWGALTTFAVGLATAVGAVLPWLVTALVIGVPVLLLVRALRRRTAPEAGQSSE